MAGCRNQEELWRSKRSLNPPLAEPVRMRRILRGRNKVPLSADTPAVAPEICTLTYRTRTQKGKNSLLFHRSYERQTDRQTDRTGSGVELCFSCIWLSKLSNLGGWFNIKMPSYQFRKSHCGDKTILWSSYLHNGISYTGKMTFLYWIRTWVWFVIWNGVTIHY